MPDKSNFDSVSSYYDALVRLVFGKAMSSAQFFFLKKVKSGASVLVLGGGTGLWLNELLDNNPTCKIVYIDSSARMIARAKRNTNNDDRIDFRIGTEHNLHHSYSFDVVILYCYLDLFSDSLLPDVITRIKDAVTKESQWIVVDFVSTSWWHKVMLAIMYNFFRIASGIKNNKLPKWEQALKQASLTKVDEKVFYHRFIKSAVFVDSRV